ncbi:MAG: hypothetical protein LUQ10_00450, partial [Methanothrix sp.]|nr:hypothetical protein [Methanothrix sp.]
RGLELPGWIFGWASDKFISCSPFSDAVKLEASSSVWPTETLLLQLVHLPGTAISREFWAKEEPDNSSIRIPATAAITSLFCRDSFLIMRSPFLLANL